MGTTTKTWYRKISPESVPRETRKAAEDMLAYVAKDLSLGDVSIIWVLPEKEVIASMENLIESDGPFTGHTRSFTEDKMWITANQSIEEIRLTVAHEARHLWQIRRYRPAITKEEIKWREKDAEDYERDIEKKVSEFEKTLRTMASELRDLCDLMSA